jgi:hypothetical protein
MSEQEQHKHQLNIKVGVEKIKKIEIFSWQIIPKIINFSPDNDGAIQNQLTTREKLSRICW